MLSLKQDMEAQKEGVRIEAYKEGREEGIVEERARTEVLAKALVKVGRESDIVRMSLDRGFKTQLLEEFGIE